MRMPTMLLQVILKYTAPKLLPPLCSCVFTITQLHKGGSSFGAVYFNITCNSMVGMRMGYYSSFYRLLRVDIKITVPAIKSIGIENQEIVQDHLAERSK